MIRISVLIVVAIFAALLPLAGQPQKLELPICRELQSAGTENLTSCLENAKPNSRIECVLNAMEQLAVRVSNSSARTKAGAARVIAAFLDIEDPSYEAKKRSGIRDRPLLPSERYPAIESLMNIGKPALPELLNVIRSASSNEISRSNAVTVIGFLYREDQEGGVRLLNDENRSSRDQGVSARFLAAAREEVKDCLNEQRAKCEMILWDQSGRP